MELADRNINTATEIMFMERANLWVKGWGILAGKKKAIKQEPYATSRTEKYITRS